MHTAEKKSCPFCVLYNWTIWHTHKTILVPVGCSETAQWLWLSVSVSEKENWGCGEPTHTIKVEDGFWIPLWVHHTGRAHTRFPVPPERFYPVRSSLRAFTHGPLSLPTPQSTQVSTKTHAKKEVIHRHATAERVFCPVHLLTSGYWVPVGVLFSDPFQTPFHFRAHINGFDQVGRKHHVAMH